MAASGTAGLLGGWRRVYRDAADAAWWAWDEAGEAIRAHAGAHRLQTFADVLARARDVSDVERALVAMAAEVARAVRVELVLDPEGGGPRVLAVAPTSASAMTEAQIEALGYPLALGLWCGSHGSRALQVYAPPGRLRGGRWSPRVVRRLTTLCSLASATVRGLRGAEPQPSRSLPEPVGRIPATVRDATYLNAVLPYALAQARRHGESLTLLCVELDGLPALGRERGPEAVATSSLRMAEAIAGVLRASDVVARLDDNRVFVVLPDTSPASALNVVSVVRAAISGTQFDVAGHPTMDASVGLASYPADASDMYTLLSLADEAMTRTRSEADDRA